MGAQKKFDYDGKDFYTAIGNLASRDYNDKEIAMNIGQEVRHIIGQRNRERTNDAESPESVVLEDVDCVPEGLTPEVFAKMKNGNYEGWNEQENSLRSMLISQVLTQARVGLRLIYKDVYNKVAAGKWKTKTVTKTEKATVSKEGVPYTEVVTTTTEQELPPNMQAISTWRYHHDPEFRGTLQQMKRMDVSVEDKTIDRIKVNVVYNKKEDTELQEKK